MSDCKMFSNNSKTTTSYTEDNINNATLIIDLASLKFNFEKQGYMIIFLSTIQSNNMVLRKCLFPKIPRPLISRH